MISTRIYPRFLAPPKGSFFLFGPRGTGKSTWLRATFPNAHTFDLLDESLYQSLLVDIGRFAGELRAVPKGTVVVVDEIQRIPPLLNEVHRHIEDRGLRFVLCGSSARRLKTAGTNLLAGRAVRRNMHPLLPKELGRDFEIESILRWGSLPVVRKSPAMPASPGRRSRATWASSKTRCSRSRCLPSRRGCAFVNEGTRNCTGPIPGSREP